MPTSTLSWYNSYYYYFFFLGGGGVEHVSVVIVIVALVFQFLLLLLSFFLFYPSSHLLLLLSYRYRYCHCYCYCYRCCCCCCWCVYDKDHMSALRVTNTSECDPRSNEVTVTNKAQKKFWGSNVVVVVVVIDVTWSSGKSVTLGVLTRTLKVALFLPTVGQLQLLPRHRWALLFFARQCSLPLSSKFLRSR